jgi:hypothetical protein
MFLFTKLQSLVSYRQDILKNISLIAGAAFLFSTSLKTANFKESISARNSMTVHYMALVLFFPYKLILLETGS